MKITEGCVKFLFCVVTFIFIFFFTGCSFKKKSFQKTPTIINQGVLSKKDFIVHSFKDTPLKTKPSLNVQGNKFESIQETIQWVEAQLSDIPSLLLSKAIDASRDAYGQYGIVYQTSQSFEEIKKFYLQEMERTGWKKEASFEGSDLLYLFKKEGTLCIISIRQCSHYWGVFYTTTIHVYVQR